MQQHQGTKEHEISFLWDGVGEAWYAIGWHRNGWCLVLKVIVVVVLIQGHVVMVFCLSFTMTLLQSGDELPHEKVAVLRSKKKIHTENCSFTKYRAYRRQTKGGEI